MNVKFTIYGNQDNPKGNPVPYTRVVGRALWVRGAKRYAEWKAYVQSCFFTAVDQETRKLLKAGNRQIRYGKPIELPAHTDARMDLKIFWANGSHGDPDNVFKGIADALFVNDKNLDGSFESIRAPDAKGRVEVEIRIGETA